MDAAREVRRLRRTVVGLFVTAAIGVPLVAYVAVPKVEDEQNRRAALAAFHECVKEFGGYDGDPLFRPIDPDPYDGDARLVPYDGDPNEKAIADARHLRLAEEHCR